MSAIVIIYSTIYKLLSQKKSQLNCILETRKIIISIHTKRENNQ